VNDPASICGTEAEPPPELEVELELELHAASPTTTNTPMTDAAIDLTSDFIVSPFVYERSPGQR
jgi:hypothetical protein